MEQKLLETSRLDCLFLPVILLIVTSMYFAYKVILRLILEYSRLMSLDRESMTYIPPS